MVFYYVHPSIFINDVEGTGNALPFSNNYKFSYEFNVSSLDGATASSRNEASISGNYIDNILEFAESFSLKAMSDIYEYLAMINIQSHVYEKNNSLIIESPSKINKMIISKENNYKYIVVKNEDGTFFDSRQYIKKSNLTENMGIVFNNLKTKEIKLFNNVETEVGYIKVTGEANNIFEFSADNNKVQFIDNNDTNVTQISSSNGKMEMLDGFIVHKFNIETESGYDYVVFENNSSKFTLINNKSETNNSFFRIKSDNFDFIQASLIDGVDITTVGKFNVLDAYNNLVKDTWLVSSIDEINNTGIVVSSNKSFIKINTENNMEMAGKETLYIKFKNIILDGVVSFTRKEEVNDFIVYSDKKNLMNQDASIYFYDGDGVNGKYKYTKSIYNKDGFVSQYFNKGQEYINQLKYDKLTYTHISPAHYDNDKAEVGFIQKAGEGSGVQNINEIGFRSRHTGVSYGASTTYQTFETVYGSDRIYWKATSKTGGYVESSFIELVPTKVTVLKADGITKVDVVVYAFKGTIPAELRISDV